MEYAIFKSGGKQYFAVKGGTLVVDKLAAEESKSYLFEDVLLYVSDGDFKLGKPNLAGVKVKAKILKQKKGDKIKVEKFKAKSKYRRTMGFRPQLTEVMIEGIVSDGKKEKTPKTTKPKKA